MKRKERMIFYLSTKRKKEKKEQNDFLSETKVLCFVDYPIGTSKIL
jgi:hypothetical protein